MIGLVLGLIVAVGLSAGGYFKVQQWKTEAKAEGVAECQAAHQAADDKLKALADALQVETANHVADMVTAYEQAEKEIAPRVVTKIVRAEADVRSGAIPSCALPPAALLNLNAARLSMRRETAPPAAIQPASAPQTPPEVSAPLPAVTAPLRPANPVAAAPAGKGREPLSKVGK